MPLHWKDRISLKERNQRNRIPKKFLFREQNHSNNVLALSSSPRSSTKIPCSGSTCFKPVFRNWDYHFPGASTLDKGSSYLFYARGIHPLSRLGEVLLGSYFAKKANWPLFGPMTPNSREHDPEQPVMTSPWWSCRWPLPHHQLLPKYKISQE